MTHTSIRLPDELIERLDRAAGHYMRNRSNMIAFALAEWLRTNGYEMIEHRQPQKPKRKG